MNEVWKDIIGYEGLYMISNYGNIKSLKRYVKRGNNKIPIKELVLKQSILNTGYLYVRLSKNGKYKSFLIHRLIAIHFIPNNDPNLHINHKNKNRLDNTIENLEWVSQRENNTHSSINRNKSSKYPGVYYDNNRKKYSSTITINGKQKRIGRFEMEIDAYMAYLKEQEKYNIKNKFASVTIPLPNEQTELI